MHLATILFGFAAMALASPRPEADAAPEPTAAPMAIPDPLPQLGGFGMTITGPLGTFIPNQPSSAPRGGQGGFGAPPPNNGIRPGLPQQQGNRPGGFFGGPATSTVTIVYTPAPSPNRPNNNNQPRPNNNQPQGWAGSNNQPQPQPQPQGWGPPPQPQQTPKWAGGSQNNNQPRPNGWQPYSNNN